MESVGREADAGYRHHGRISTLASLSNELEKMMAFSLPATKKFVETLTMKVDEIESARAAMGFWEWAPLFFLCQKRADCAAGV